MFFNWMVTNMCYYGLTSIAATLLGINRTSNQTYMVFRIQDRTHKIFIFIPSMSNKCYDRSMKMNHPALLGNNDRPTNQPTDGRTDRPGNREVSLQIGAA